MSAFREAAARVAGGGSPAGEARALVEQMTLEEKLWCLDGDIRFWPGVVDMAHGGYNEHPWPAAKVERLGIPGLDFVDGPRGCVVGPCTAFPVSMARGASFDPGLEGRVGAAIGAELRAQGATYTGAVCINLLRHPAWGRAQETYGEDPYHVGEMGAALSEGLQQHVMACMKHFAANSMENARFKVDITADERALHEVYLPHFKRVANSGVASVMSAYNSLNGEWCGDNETLLTTILRSDWGFDGFVITDFSKGLRDPVKSVIAGCNVEMPFRQQRAVALGAAVAAGELAVEQVEARVVETVATFLRFAEVYDRKPDATVVACAEHRALAREAAAASMVLLRNAGSLLPLTAEALRKVVVLGPLAAVANLGDGGSSNVIQPDVVTPLAGLQAALPEAEIAHSDTSAEIAVGADLVVVVVGYTKEDEGEFISDGKDDMSGSMYPPSDDPVAGFPPGWELPASSGAKGPRERPKFSVGGDRSSLQLKAEDEALIRAAAALCDRVVVAVMAGSAVVMPWLEDVSATLMLWYPGMEGGHALADVLLGQAEPGGRLPFAVPRSASDLVDFDREATQQVYGLLHGQWWLDHNETVAQLPFGFGLGYTSFAVGSSKQDGDRVEVELRNTGARHGSTVVQVYGSVPGSEFERPLRRLVGFQRVALGAGESSRVEIAVDLSQLDIRKDGAWLRESLPVEFSIGLDAANTRALN